jgi:hypothetical protein
LHRACIWLNRTYFLEHQAFWNTMTTADLIYERVKELPESLAKEVLDFIGYLQGRRRWQDLMEAQGMSLANIWDNPEDRVWDDV